MHSLVMMDVPSGPMDAPSLLPWIGFVLATGAVTLAIAAGLSRHVLASCSGTEEMQEIGRSIREGAHAFLRRQYRTVALLAVAIAVVVFVIYQLTDGAFTAWRMTIAFVVGATCSAAAGTWGMFVSVNANTRVANAARTNVRQAFLLALRGGTAAALPVVAGSLLGATLLFLLFGGLDAPHVVPYQIVGFAFGASFVALFSQLGGGIYTKAADIGADLVGKVEADIPEDDPRNPAVIADLVGDNVGDCAGRGADIFESASAENIGAMILGVALFPRFGVSGILFPLVAGAFGLVASLIGVAAVRMKHEAEDPMSALGRGHVVTLLCAGLGLYLASRLLLGVSGWLFAAASVGLVTSYVLAIVTRYYTGLRRGPVRRIATSSLTGATTNLISGLAVGLESTALPTLTICAALLGAYGCGSSALPGTPGAGLYGTAIATIGMLSTVGFVLTMDMFGPITDNAGGIVEMAGEPEEVRARTDRLDAVGNTTKATTKGYAIGSATLAAFLLFSAYLEEVTTLARSKLPALATPGWSTFRFEHVDIGKVPVFVGALVGGAVVFVFSGLTMRAVTHDAHAVIEAVRGQLREHPGILSRTEKPDYGVCVDIVTRGALEAMMVPGFLAVGTPVALGLLFRIARDESCPLLGAEVVAAELMVATITGVLLASTMNTSGGAWDNAKKLIETGYVGGKGSEAHRAAIVGDGVGDPFKDTAGPSLHVLIKLLGTVALVAAPLFV